MHFFFSCGFKWSGYDLEAKLNLSYVAYIYTFGFVVPVSIISTSYYKIIKTIRIQVSVLSDNFL